MEQKHLGQTALNLWDKIWRDKHGDVVIWQTPNVPIIAWAVLTTLSLFFGRTFGDVLAVLGEAALIIWSLLEIFKGANYFRRLLGMLVLAFAIASLLKTLL